MKDHGRGNKVFVIGEAGLIDLILAAGFEWDDQNPDYVVVGLDNDVTYEKFVLATLAIQKGLPLSAPIQIKISLPNGIVTWSRFFDRNGGDCDTDTADFHR